MYLQNCLNCLTLPMLLLESSYVYILSFRPEVPRVSLAKVPFLVAFFFVGLT